jgi:hypothetical protein
VTALWDTGGQVSIVPETFMHKQSLTSKLRNVEELLGVQGVHSVRLNETQPDIFVPFLVTKDREYWTSNNWIQCHRTNC